MVYYLAHHHCCNLITYKTATCPEKNTNWSKKNFKYMSKMRKFLVNEKNFDCIKSTQKKMIFCFFECILFNIFAHVCLELAKEFLDISVRSKERIKQQKKVEV